MWSRLVLPALVAALVAMPSVASDGFDLLSTREYKSELSLRASAPGSKLVARAADFNAPEISVVAPNRAAPIQPPVDIDLRFKPAEGAAVNVSTLRIMYGFLKLDVTRRILDAPGVQVSATGLKASGARLPSGSHKLIIEVADNLGRTARQPLEFTVK